MTDDATPEPHDNPPPEPSEILKGKAAWWYFMEAKATGELPNDAPLQEVELVPERVGRLAQRDHLDRLPSFTPHPVGSMPCHACGAQVPRDLSVCVYCGQPGRTLATPRAQLLIIDAVPDPDIRADLMRLLPMAGVPLPPDELAHALTEPPAVFSFHAAPEQSNALLARLSEVGVRAWLSPASTPGVSLTREIFESALRDRASLRSWLATLAICALITFFAPVLGVLISAAALTFLYARQHAAYLRRYTFDPTRLLDAMTGLGELAPRVTRALGALQDEDARLQLTACLISYYAIWRQLASADPVQRRLLGRLREDLDDLLRQLLDACERYGALDAYARAHDLSALDALIAQLAADLPQDPRALELRQRQLDQRRQQRDALVHILDAIPLLREQLGAMAASLEALRARTVSLTLRRAAADAEDSQISSLLFDLDSEIETFEQTVDALATVTR
jgi:hypothetical protein